MKKDGERAIPCVAPVEEDRRVGDKCTRVMVLVADMVGSERCAAAAGFHDDLCCEVAATMGAEAVEYEEGIVTKGVTTHNVDDMVHMNEAQKSHHWKG